VFYNHRSVVVMKVSVVFVFPPRKTFSTLWTSPFSCSFRPFIHPPLPLRQLRPRTLEHPPWWSSIVPSATVLPHHTSSSNLCTLSLNRVPATHRQAPPIPSERCVVSDSTNLCLSPPFLSQWRRFARPLHDL
jgi:hypothetical protein